MRRIPFSVIQVSSEDHSGPGTNLNEHSPTSKGWLSSKNCRYPQELIISLKKRAKVCKIQLLSHPSCISSRIGVQYADDPTSHQASNLGFQRLGYISLADNSKSGYVARELKSAVVNANAKMIKFILHNNYANDFNTHKQVGIVAINILGKPLEAFRNRRDNLRKNLLCVDDLAFRMYQDPQVAKIITLLEEKRLKYHNDSEMEAAKNMRYAVDELTQAGLILGKKSIDYQKARANADFTSARNIEKDIETYRMNIYDKLQEQISLCLPGAKPRYDSPKLFEPAPPVVLKPAESPAQNDDSEEELKFEDVTPTPPAQTPEPENLIQDPEPEAQLPPPPEPQAEPEPEPEPEPAPVVSNSHDDMVLPALANKGNIDYAEMYKDESKIDDVKEDQTPKKNCMTKKEQQQASEAILVFGQDVVESAYAKNFRSRSDAITKIKTQLQLYDPKNCDHNTSSMMKATTFMMLKVSKDKVLFTFNAATDLIKFVFREFVPKHKIQRSDYAAAIDKVVPQLITRVGDSAPRIRAAADSAVLELSTYRAVQPLKSVPQHVLQPFKTNNISQKLALGRCQLVNKFIRQHPLSDNRDITVRQIMAFLSKALEHTSGPVREIAEAITLLIYEQRGSEVRPCLPPDNDQTRKKPAFKRLFEKFDELDMEEAQAIEDGQNEVIALRNELAKVPGSRKARSAVNMNAETASMVDLREGTLSRLNNSTLDVKDGGEVADIDFENTCIFCGEKNEEFSNEGLEMHYMKQCAMLMCCKDCKQVVEVSGLTEHQLTECDNKANFKQCNRCMQAVPAHKFSLHSKVKTCPNVKNGEVHCPLCQQQVEATDDGWKEHLTAPMKCAFNSRRKNNPLNK